MIKKFTSLMALLTMFAVSVSPALASEADLVVPNIKQACGFGHDLLLIGLGISVIGLIFGLVEFLKIKKLDVHKAMDEVGNTIFETCKTYLIQQGFNRFMYRILLRVPSKNGHRRSVNNPCMVSNRDIRFICCCMVWYKNEHFS